MRISVNYDNGQIFQHFGRTEMFKIYEVEEDGKVVKEYLLPGAAEGHAALSEQLKENHIDVAICGGLGMGMLNALEAAGIQVCANVSGDADHAVQEYLAGRLEYSRDAHNCGGAHH